MTTFRYPAEQVDRGVSRFGYPIPAWTLFVSS
jgi:hypothetical protein